MRVRSSSVSRSDIWIRRARPRTGESYLELVDGVGEEDGGSSRMQTAAEFGFPDPRRMASRPVDWMVPIRVEGGEVEVIVIRREGMEKVVEEMPALGVSC